MLISNRIKSFFVSEEIDQVNVAFPWFLVLRWGEVICQILLVIVVSLYIDIDFPLVFLSLIVSTEAISNLVLHFRFRRGQTVSGTVIFMIFILDSLLLTGLLHLTGGAMNPFTFLYLVHIVIAAIILAPKWSWSITIFTLACYGLLFLPPPVTRDLSGTLVPGASGRTEVQGIGVQSVPIGWFTRSNFGGRFSSMLKYAGWDGIVIEGKAERTTQYSD